MEEVETLLATFYGGEKPPPFEVEAFVRFFDRKKRGKVSWADFQDGFGLAAKVGSGSEAGAAAAVAGVASVDPMRLFELAAGTGSGTGSSSSSSGFGLPRLLASGGTAANATSADADAAATTGAAAEVGADDASRFGGAPAVKLSVGGTLSVELEGGAKLEVDAAQYLDGLKVP